jgi:hypothetical protein
VPRSCELVSSAQRNCHDEGTRANAGEMRELWAGATLRLPSSERCRDGRDERLQVGELMVNVP